MSKSVYWCPHCGIPVIENKICPLCKTEGEVVSTNGICNPVFVQEKRLLSCILGEDINNSNVWYLGSSQYLVDGVRKRIPYGDFYKAKKHLECSDSILIDAVHNDNIFNLEKYLNANQRYINELIFEAETYVTDLVRELEESKEDDISYIPTVSFSGGKDSTVVSRIVRDALQNESVIHFFGDTTLEFPSTHVYVDGDFRVENPFTPMIPSETENDFFKLCNVFGPPSKFERWCCTIFKTSNLNSEYQNLDGNSLTFLGIRRNESKERQKYERTQKHSKIGSQINAMPIIDWYDCDVWLYILYKGIKFNEAYRWGYKRVGCWCCPNNSDWSMMLTDIYYPQLSNKWKNILYDFATKTNKTDIEDYVENGKWKTRKGASGLETRNVTIADTPCNLSDRARNIVIKKKLRPDVIEFFKPFGELEIFNKEEATYITVTEREIRNSKGEVVHKRRKVCDLVITWGTPVLKVLPEKGTDIQLIISRLKCQLRKYQYCIRCSACDSICPYGAINTLGDSRYSVDESRCKQNMNECSKCIAKFYNGCITCQVLAGKKDIPGEEEEV
jgi:phosphoadenosine phosphosulfate reductase